MKLQHNIPPTASDARRLQSEARLSTLGKSAAWLAAAGFETVSKGGKLFAHRGGRLIATISAGMEINPTEIVQVSMLELGL